MTAGRCIHCQAELPDAGRFCVMCGRRVGQLLRDRSSDRRVYTSALGHSVPSDLDIEIERRERSGELPRGEPSGEVRREFTGEEPSQDPRYITGRTGRTGKRRSTTGASALAELWRSLLWAVLLSTLGAVVAWGVYVALRHPAPPAPAESGGTAVRNPPSRPRPPAPKVVPSRELIIPVAAPPGAKPGIASSGPVAAPIVTPAASPVVRLPGPEASAWQNNDIDFVASQHSPQVRACYDRAFRHAADKAPAGRVELSFVLFDTGEAGQARDIVTELNLLGEPSVAACLEELLTEWRFPRPPPLAPGLPPHRLRYPFVFTPAPIQ